MKYEELPITPLWIDFLRGRLPLLPGPMEMLPIRKADAPGISTVTVIVNFYASLFGGPLSQILKCLTGIMVCERLRNQGIPARCLCRIVEPHSGFNAHAIMLLNKDSEIRRFALTEQEREQLKQTGTMPMSRSADMLAEIKQTGAGRFDEEILELLKNSFAEQECISAANARWIASLFREWDVTVADSAAPEQHSAWEKARKALLPERQRIQSLIQKQYADLAGSGYAINMPQDEIPSCLIQSMISPAAVFIADPLELHDFALAAPVYKALGLAPPLVWPRGSATIVNARNRKTLNRYQIKPEQFFGGEQFAGGYTWHSIYHEAIEALQKLQRTAQECLTETGALVSSDKKFVKIHEKRRKKIAYQLDKLQRHCAASAAVSEQAAMRKIRRARNWIAPSGELQENGLAGIFLPLHYSRAGMHVLYEKLDAGALDHQLIDLD